MRRKSDRAAAAPARVAGGGAPLSLAHTESSLGWGGQELRTLTEARGFIERGHRVTLLCPEEARIHGEAARFGVPVVALPMARKRVAGVKALRQWIRANPVDLVNSHSSTDAWLTALACSILDAPPPMVRTRHISAPIPRNPLTRWLYTSATRHIVTTGETLRAQVIASSGIEPERVTSVPTGIDTERFSPGDRQQARAALGLPGDLFIVGIVATLRSWKGHRHLVEAYARAALPDSRLLIVGDGPQREALTVQIGELGLGDRVLMPGNQADVSPWLRAMDVFVLPSYANEGVPQALVQAMLTGLPCITTAIGAIPEAAVAEQTALVVPTSDPPALAAAIRRLAADPALRSRLGVAARLRAAERFSLESMLDRMEAVFRAVLAARKP